MRALGFSLGNGILSALVLAGAGFAVGMGVESEDAGTILGFLVSAGFVGGFVTGVSLTFATLLYLTRKGAALPLPVSEEARARSARRALVASFALLVVGVGTSLVGFVLSLTMGLISLAIAMLIVRPLGAVFAALHLGLAAYAGIAATRASAHTRVTLVAASVISLAGATCAGLIAAFGATFFERLMEQAMDVLLR